MLSGFWDPRCHPCNLIDLLNTALARKDSAENICMISEGYKAHRGVTGPMNFKKKKTFFFRKIVLPGFWGLWLPSITLIDFANTAVVSKSSLEPKWMIAEVYRTHSVVTGPMNSEKIRTFFRENHAPGFWGTCLPSRHFN